MGSRNSDPYCEKLSFFSPSDVDKGYSAFMRINPIIYWKFDEIWKFLLQYKLKFCSLYEQGYTYLGNMNNSYKNPTLKQENGSYKPAWECNK